MTSVPLSNKQSNRKPLVLALLAFCLCLAAALYYINTKSNELHNNSTVLMLEMEQKMRTASNLAHIIERRSYTLLTMLIEKDYFLLDELNQDFEKQAFLFRKNRNLIKTFRSSAQQQKLLDQLFQLTSSNYVTQQKVVELLFDEDMEGASRILFSKAIPDQKPMVLTIQKFIDLVEKENAMVLANIQTSLAKNRSFTILLILTLSGFCIAFISVLINILKASDAALLDNKTITHSMIGSALDAIILTDKFGNISTFNQSAVDLFGYNAGQIKRKPIDTLLPKYAFYLNELLNAKTTGQTGIQFEDMAIHQNQTNVPVSVTLSDTTIDGPSRFNLIIRDLTVDKENERRMIKKTQQLSEARAKYKKLSETDALTKIPNRRAYQNRLVDEINAAKRSKQPLALIVFDIDFFKEYNDHYGHDIGDVVLKRIADVISTTLPRSTDFAARIGGEEFIVLLPSTDTFGAYQVAERIRLNIKALEIKHEKSRAQKVVSISAGVSSISGHLLSDVELFKQADTALYQAKEQGRNNTVTFKSANNKNVL